MKKLAIILLIFLTGCLPEPTLQMKHGTLKTEQLQRFEVTLVEIFEDKLAYGDRRGIYLIKDLEKNKEFIGISGIGISELGSHLVDDTNVPDER